MRDLFKKAKENSPCLIFVDEIDAVGRSRGAGMGQGNDEREQTRRPFIRKYSRNSQSYPYPLKAASDCTNSVEKWTFCLDNWLMR